MSRVFVSYSREDLPRVQPLLDAVTRLLPAPSDIKNEALDMDQDEAPVSLTPDENAPTVALAFKLEDGQYGQLTYIRVYQGKLEKGDTVINVRSGKKVKIGRLVRMHADQMEDIHKIPAGYIGALFGVDCASGDTFTSPEVRWSNDNDWSEEFLLRFGVDMLFWGTADR